MSSCNPTPTLTTVFPAVASETTVTSFTVVLQEQPDGDFVIVALPVTKTSTVTVDQTSTLYASCSSSSSRKGPGVVMAMTTPMSTNSQSTTTPPQPSSTPSTDTNGIVPATLAPTPMVNPPPVSQRRGPNYALIGTGIVAGLILLISVVALIWFLRKNYRKSYALVDERDVVFPYPQSRQLDLTNESSPYESGLLGRSMRRTGSWRSVESHDGGLDSPPTALLTPAMSASGSLGTMHGAPTRVGEVGREASPFADPLSSDPASPDSYYSPSDSLSSGSVYSSNSTIISFQQRQLQAIDSLLTPKPR